MKIAGSVDLRQFNEALFYRQETTNKELPDILNTAAKNAAYRAAQFTPVATSASIRQSLKGRPHLLAALTSLSLRSQGRGYVQAPEFRQEMENFIKRRLGGKKYLRSGWAPCIRAMGATFRGGVNQKAEDQFARKTGRQTGIRSKGTRAVQGRLVAILDWICAQPTAAKDESAERIALAALQKGIDFVATDMIRHAQEKLAKLYL